MRTIYTDDPLEAAAFIKRGGIVAFPTETVYGLGANAFDAAAVAKIFEAKQRPADNPLIVHVASVEQIGEVASEITETARRLVGTFFPGPLTVVLRKSDHLPEIATAGLETVGVRMPRLRIAADFLRACEVPVAAPSANLSGRPSPTTWRAVAEDLDGRVECILQGDASELGLESTVVDCTGDHPIVLRQGSVTLEQLRVVVPETVGSAGGAESARSPGTRYRHYKPRANVLLIEHPQAVTRETGTAYIGLAASVSPFDFQLVAGSVEQYASAVYEFLREADRRGIHTIYCQEVAQTGVGAALMDRLRRAAE